MIEHKSKKGDNEKYIALHWSATTSNPCGGFTVVVDKAQHEKSNTGHDQ